MTKKISRRRVRRGRPIIRIERRGPRLAIKNVSQRVFDLLHGELTYDHVRQIRGKEAKRSGRRVEVVPVECYRYVEDDDDLVPPQLLTTAGWFPRVSRALSRAGYAVKYRDNTPESRGGPDVYTPLWKRLADVRYKWMQKRVLELICANPYGQIICPTGYGKSFLIKCLATLLPKARFVISTHSRDVIEMLYDDLDADLPSVGLIHSKKKVLNQRLMCVSGKSLHHAPLDTDFLIIDEGQEFATQDYLGKLAKFKRSRNFMFSANEKGDRIDNADFELEGPFGPPLITIPYHEAVKHGAIVQVKVRWVDVVMDVNPCEDYEDPTARVRNGIWRNKVRNELIAKTAREYPDEQVLIVVDTVEHACFLKGVLPEFTMVYGEGSLDEERRQRFIKWGLINQDEPDMTPERRWKLKKAFEAGKLRKAIATSVWNRGVNFTQLQVLIRADAKATPVQDKQIPGRLSRLSPKKDYGLLIDFYDQFDKTYARKAADRKRQYRKMRWDMLEPDDEGLTRLAQGSLFDHE